MYIYVNTYTRTHTHTHTNLSTGTAVAPNRSNSKIEIIRGSTPKVRLFSLLSFSYPHLLRLSLRFSLSYSNVSSPSPYYFFLHSRLATSLASFLPAPLLSSPFITSQYYLLSPSHHYSLYLIVLNQLCICVCPTIHILSSPHSILILYNRFFCIISCFIVSDPPILLYPVLFSPFCTILFCLIFSFSLSSIFSYPLVTL